MKRQQKGILLEKNGAGVVFTDEGDFCRISPPSAEIGEEVLFSRGAVRQWWALSLAAAALAVFVGLSMFRFIYTSPVAYVALDINPSIELGIDHTERVIEVSSLNEDARRLVAGLSLRRRPITEAIALVIDRAEGMHYLSAGSPGVVLVTVVPVQSGSAVPETRRLAQAAVQQLEKKNVPAKVVAATVPSSLRKEARRLGLSPGRYALKIGAGTDKQVMTVHELKQEGLAQLEQRRQVTVEELLRAGHQDKVIVVPPRAQHHGKKYEKRDNGESTVPDNEPQAEDRSEGTPSEGTPPPVPEKPAQEASGDDDGAGKQEKTPPGNRMDHRKDMSSRGQVERGSVKTDRRDFIDREKERFRRGL